MRQPSTRPNYPILRTTGGFMRKLATLLTAVVLVAPVRLPAQSAEGSWNAEFRSSRVHLNIRMDTGPGFSNYGRTFPIDDLSALQRNGRNVTFELRRPAGVLRFEGVGSESRASGMYEFTADPAFKRSLESMGFSRLSGEDLFKLAMHSVSVEDVRYLQRNVRDGLNSRELVRMLDHGADVEFVRGIYAAGFTSLSSEELTRTRDHGVDADFIQELRAQDIKLTLDEYVRAKDHGVSPKYIRAMRDLGFRNDFEQLVRAKDHGVGPEFIREMTQAGLPELTLSHYIQLHDHGVSADFAQSMIEMGYKNIGADDLRRLRDHGVSPAWARRANKDAGRQLSVDELIRRRSRGDY